MRTRDLSEFIKSTECFCGAYKLAFQSMCDCCVQKLPNHIKYELWRPMTDGFIQVLTDALKFLVSTGMVLDSLTYDESKTVK